MMIVQPSKVQENLNEASPIITLSEELLVKSNLPIIIIDTNSQDITYTKKGESSGESIQATFNVYLPEHFQAGDFSPYLQSNIDIGVRGNTSRLLPKKQYSISLLDEKGNEKEHSLLGMPKNSKWILNASFEDQSLLRNKLAYDVSRKIMEYAPRSEFCEVYLVDDGEVLNVNHYRGVYLLVEKINRGDSRVDISETVDHVEKTSFIVARNRVKPSDILLNTYGFETYLYDYNMIVEYPKSKLTDEKKTYINQTITQFERVLYSDLFNDPTSGYAAYLEVESFIDYFIINEFFKNTDAGIFSTYLYKDYDSKIKAGPVWDFDSAMGNSTHLFPYYDATGFYMPQTAWFERLIEDRLFVEKMIDRYRLLRSTYLSEEYLLKQINSYVEELGEAVQRNFEKWPVELCNQSEMLKKYYAIIQPYEHDVEALMEFLDENPQYKTDTQNRAQSYSEEIEKLKQFICERATWMDDYIDSLLKWTE